LLLDTPTKKDFFGQIIKMSNIEQIRLMTQKDIFERFGVPIPAKSDGFPLSTIIFKQPSTFTTLSVEELKTILRLWIQAEEMRYPLEKGYKGRWFLFEDAKRYFIIRKNAGM